MTVFIVYLVYLILNTVLVLVLVDQIVKLNRVIRELEKTIDDFNPKIDN